MNLVNPFYLWLELACVVLLLLLFSRKSKLSDRFKRFADPRFEQHYYRLRSPFWHGLKLGISILALAAIVLALVRPQWDFENKQMDKRGNDIVFIIDVSKSMLAEDVMPNRLMLSLLQLNWFIDEMGTDRLGVISFAGVAKLECPLTDDYDAVRIVLQGLSTNSAERTGTNIGSALELAMQSFRDISHTGAIVLISDGEDLQGDGIRQARELRKKGIKLYTLGVGSPDGASITNPETGQQVMSKLDEQTLKQLASVTGGEYNLITPGGIQISSVLKSIRQGEKTRQNRQSLSVLKEQYHLFALLALVLLIIETLVDPNRRTRGIMAAENHHEA